MKNLFTLTLLFCSFYSVSQNSDTVVSVEDKFWGVQTNGLELLYYQEHKLTPSIALKGEVGFVNGFSGGSFVENGFVSSLYFAAEPRWYYNLKKRERKNKNISYNAGNYIGFRIFYSPKWVTITSFDQSQVDNDHAIIIAPMFGMRRNIGKYFDFELGLGAGYGMYFDGSENYFDSGLFILQIGRASCRERV